MNSVPSCYWPGGDWAEGIPIAVPEAEAHHLVRVLRLKVGDPIRLFDGAGAEAGAVIVSISRAELVVRPGPLLRHAPPPVRVTLFQSILKGERMDEVVQRAVELGCAELAPLAAERSVVKLEGMACEKRLIRWRAIAEAAARQSGNPFLMTVRAPVSAAESAGETAGMDMALFGSLEAGARPLWDMLAQRQARGIRVGLWIGPEGDWSPAEYAALRGSAARPVTFGPLVLRAETAAFYGLSVIGAAATSRTAVPVSG